MALCYPLRGQPSYMRSHGFDVLLISSDGEEVPQIAENEGCPHMIVPMTRQITPFKDIRAIFRLTRIFKKYKPDIVHAESAKAGLLGMVAARFAGVKIRIYTNAGLAMLAKKGITLFLLVTVEKIIYAFATNVWPNSRSTMNYIQEHGYTRAGKIQVIGEGSSNGIDINRFNRNTLDPLILAGVKNSIAYDPANTYLLFSGRLVADKGIKELVAVFRKLQKQIPQLRLVLTGRYEKNLDPLAGETENEIENNTGIIHISWTDNVEYYMAISDYFVFPSYREGFPNVLLEAGAMQLPIVCSRILGNIDIVTEGDTGLIFERMDEVSMETKLLQAFSEPEQMKMMALKLYERVVSVYKRELFWEEMLRQYSLLLDKTKEDKTAI